MAERPDLILAPGEFATSVVVIKEDGDLTYKAFADTPSVQEQRRIGWDERQPQVDEIRSRIEKLERDNATVTKNDRELQAKTLDVAIAYVATFFDIGGEPGEGFGPDDYRLLWEELRAFAKKVKTGDASIGTQKRRTNLEDDQD